MSKVDELKIEIERLPEEEFTELVRWLSEKDWERWDKEIEADSEAGKLDFLVREALDAKSKENSQGPVKHRTTGRFWVCYPRLPESVQKVARRNFDLLKKNPRHPYITKRLASFGR
jgi:hypothetical protein